MPKDGREITGPSLNPNRRTEPPQLFFDGNSLRPHVQGRMEATALTLVNVAYLRSAGMLPGGHQAVGYSGARYQDVRNSAVFRDAKWVMAHRLPCNPTVGGRDLPVYGRAAPGKFQDLLKAPLAVTDPMSYLVNYADRLFEICAAPGVARAVASVLRGQRSGRPVDAGLVRGVLETEAGPDQLRCYTQAQAKAEANLKQHWTPVSLAALGHELRFAQPTSELVERRLSPTAAEVCKVGPTHYGDLPVILLATCGAIAGNEAPDILLPGNIEEYCERLEAAHRRSA
jgi:hypothetical protein